MKAGTKLFGAVLAGFLAVAVTASAQTGQKAEEAKKAAPAPEAMPVPQPGPEHAVFKMDEGTWDATVEVIMAPGTPAAVSKGTETNTLVSGLWLVTDFKSTMMNQPFQGHGIAGYDAGKKKYVSTWVDSMSTGFNMGESTYDPTTKTMTGWMEGPDPSGKLTKSRAVAVYKDADTRVFTMYSVGPDGKELQTMKITYKRVK